jgi:hypothetical protein
VVPFLRAQQINRGGEKLLPRGAIDALQDRHGSQVDAQRAGNRVVEAATRGPTGLAKHALEVLSGGRGSGALWSGEEPNAGAVPADDQPISREHLPAAAPTDAPPLGHSESGANLLINKGADFANFSERALIFLEKSSDFDSAIPRFESWRPSQYFQ